MRKKRLPLLCAGISCLMLASAWDVAGGTLEWFPYKDATGETLIEKAPGGFVMTLRNVDPKNNYSVAIASTAPMKADGMKMRFFLTGSSANANAVLTPFILMTEQGSNQWKTFEGAAIPINSNSQQTITLDLQQDFPGSFAQNGTLRQVKFVLRSTDEAVGKQSSVAIEGLQFLDAAGNPDKSDRLPPPTDMLPKAEAQASSSSSSAVDMNAAVAPGAAEVVPAEIVFRRYEGSPGTSSMTAQKNGFTATLKNTATPHNHTVLMSSFKAQLAAQKKLVFRYQGAPENGVAQLTACLVVADGKGGFRDIIASNVSTDNSEFKTVVLALNNDFRLGDAVWPVAGVKFVLNGDGNPPDSEATVVVEDVRFANADEVSGGSADYVVVPSPRTEKVFAPANVTPVKVWFDLDNDDQNPYIMSRVSSGVVLDPNPTQGFRTQLLENADGIVELVDTPVEADVIVYSRAAHGNPDAVLAEVAKGKRLIVYGDPADAALSPVLPMDLIALEADGFRERAAIAACDNSIPLFQNVTLKQDADYGRYYQGFSKDAKVLIQLDDGTPLLAQKGNVLQFSIGLGPALLDSSVYYDKFLLRAIAMDRPEVLQALEDREAQVAQSEANQDQTRKEAVLASAGVPESEWAQYDLGMSKDNFGRFGWLIGEGLLYSNFGRDFSDTNFSQQYRFDAGGKVVVPFTNWTRRAVSGNLVFTGPNENADPQEKWDGIGVAEYTCEMTFDSAWKDKKLYFDVKEGIDDCDEVYVNGTLIGKTDQSVTHYWEAPRFYEIPHNVIRWDAPNEVRVLVENTNELSSFSSRPQLVVNSQQSSTPSLTVTRTDWVGKSYTIEDNGSTREIAISLLTPFIRYKFSQGEAYLAQENIAKYAWIPTASGIQKISLTEPGAFYDATRDGAMTAPWILLARDGATRPLLLVFTRQPASMTAQWRGSNLEGIKLTAPESESLGTIYAGWAFGVSEVDLGSMSESEIAGKIEQGVSMALNFPVACEEVFSLNPAQKTVTIIDKFIYEREPDAWNTQVSDFATVPPLAAFAAENGKMADVSEAQDLGLNTKMGPLYGKMGSDTVRYTLDLPEESSFFMPGIRANSPLEARCDEIAGKGLQYSCGGMTPLNAWTPNRPAGEFYLHNIDQFAWNFGMTTYLQGMFQYNESNRLLTQQRAGIRYIEPLELYQYKNFTRHREEPFSGLRYPVTFNSFYPNDPGYAEGVGSKLIYGDVNEGITQMTWVGEELADIYGMPGLIRANWSYFRQINRHQLYMDDYAFHAGSCREYGVGAWIDMLNGEYAGMMHYARVAQIAGDEAAYRQGMYRAAKKALPTVMRLFFNDYITEAMQPLTNNDMTLITGFGEDGYRTMIFPDSSSQFAAAMDLFDNSQGFSPTVYRLYQRYAEPEILNHLEKRALPSHKLLMENKGNRIDTYLVPLALFPVPGLDLEQYAEQVVDIWGDRMSTDWPGGKMGYHLGMPLWSKYHAPSFSKVENLKMKEAVYDVARKILHANVEANSDSRLVLEWVQPLQSLTVNGAAIAVEPGVSEMAIPLVPGENEILAGF